MYINIAKEFSETPGGRYIDEGPFSAEEFRDKMLIPALLESIKKEEKLIIQFDGGYGYASCFLEEAFGGLIRLGFSYDIVLDTLELISIEDPSVIDSITKYITEEGIRKERIREEKRLQNEGNTFLNLIIDSFPKPTTSSKYFNSSYPITIERATRQVSETYISLKTEKKEGPTDNRYTYEIYLHDYDNFSSKSVFKAVQTANKNKTFDIKIFKPGDWQKELLSSLGIDANRKSTYQRTHKKEGH